MASSSRWLKLTGSILLSVFLTVTSIIPGFYPENIKFVFNNVSSIEIWGCDGKKILVKDKESVDSFVDNIKYKLNFKTSKDYSCNSKTYYLVFRFSDGKRQMITYDKDNKILKGNSLLKLSENTYKAYDSFIENNYKI